MILIATSDISIPAKLQTTQIMDTTEIIKRLKLHNILFFLFIIFSITAKNLFHHLLKRQYFHKGNCKEHYPDI